MVLTKNKIYVVEKGTWHALVLSRDAVAVAVENADVRPEDTERKVLYEQTYYCYSRQT